MLVGNPQSNRCDVAVIGGGLVGASVGYGLSKSGLRIQVLDEGDRAFRASRGNFGLIWVQGKGADYAPYARWTRLSSDRWPEFCDELQSFSELSLGYRRPGGLEFCLNDESVEELRDEMAAIASYDGVSCEYEILDPAALREMVPGVSDAVRGACYCRHDGDVNPLALLRALHHGMDEGGVSYRPNFRIASIAPLDGGGFRVTSNDTSVEAEKVVLCAGLDNGRLAAMVDIDLPVYADRGQLLVTERTQPLLPWPTLHVRQTDNGGLQIGDSSERVGMDDRTSGEVMSMLAGRAARIFPALRDLQVVRAWAALRVKTRDGKPVYQQSLSCPGAFAVSCHSGVTLAAAHAGPLCDWIRGEDVHALIPEFSTSRFDVSH